MLLKTINYSITLLACLLLITTVFMDIGHLPPFNYV